MHRRHQIQQIVESVLVERSGLGGAIETGYDLGLKDLFGAEEKIAVRLSQLERELAHATRVVGTPYQTLEPETIVALTMERDRLKAGMKNPTARRLGRGLSVGVGVGKNLGKGFAIGIPMGIASSVASNLSGKLTNNYAYLGSGSEGREPSIPDIPEFGLEINR